MKKRIAILTFIICFTLCLTGCNSNDGDKLYNEGTNAYLDGDYTTALEKFEAAKETGVSDEIKQSDLYAFLGNCYLELSDLDNAISNYQLSLEADSDDVRNYVNLAIAYRQSGDLDKAMELYLQATEVDPDYPELNSSLGSLYVIKEDPEKAIEYFNKAIKTDPSLAVAWGNCALAYAMIDDFETADNYLKTSIEKGYENADVIENMIEHEKNS